jgi:hypothetical protein
MEQSRPGAIIILQPLPARRCWRPFCLRLNPLCQLQLRPDDRSLNIPKRLAPILFQSVVPIDLLPPRRTKVVF